MKEKFYLFVCSFIFSVGAFAQYVDESYNVMITESWTNSAWKNEMRITNTFDGNGKVTLAVGDAWSATWVATMKTYCYYKNFLLDYTLTQGLSEGNWVDAQKMLYTYSGSKVATMTGQTKMENTWFDWTKTTNTYNGSGQLIKDVDQSLDLITMQLKNSSQTTYSYNTDGTGYQNVTEVWNSGVLMLTTRDTYAYDGSKNLTSILTEDHQTGQWVNDLRSLFTYNKSTTASQVKEILDQDWSGTQWVDKTRKTYKYNANGAIIEILTEEWKNSKWENQGRITFNPRNTTETGTDLADNIELLIYPNPAADVVTIQNMSSSGSDVFIYNLTGQMVRNFHVSNTVARVNLSGLQEGNYLMRVVSGGSEKVGRFVKVNQGSSFGSVNPLSHLDYIQIDLHDTPFAPGKFDKECEINLQSFTKPGPLRPEEDILRGLLRNGAGSMHPSPFLPVVVILGFLDRIHVEAGMLQEQVVFGSYHGQLEIWRDLLQRNPVFVKAMGLSFHRFLQ